MKISPLYIGFLSLLTPLFMLAQIQQVSIGQGYSEEAYFNLSTCETINVANDAWDVAFSTIAQQDAGVFINESGSLMGTSLEAYLTGTPGWDNPTDTTNLADKRLYNPDVTWTEGAFNTPKNPMDPFDYGWGKYNPMVQAVVGDKVFVIKKRDGSFIKFQVEKYGAEGYTIKYANLDGSDDQTILIPREFGATHLYFSFESNSTVDMPKDYDLIFKRYSSFVQDINGTEFQEYIVSGVLLGPGTEAAVAKGVDPETVEHTDYFNSYSAQIDTIGHDWKSFDLNAGGWIVSEDRAHFIKTRSGEYYMIVFYDFEGSSTGITTFLKAKVGTTSTQNESIENSIKIYPNPAVDFINIESSIDYTNAMLFDQQGKKLMAQALQDNRIQLDQTLEEGNYFLVLFNKQESIAYPINVVK